MSHEVDPGSDSLGEITYADESDGADAAAQSAVADSGVDDNARVAAAGGGGDEADAAHERGAPEPDDNDEVQLPPPIARIELGSPTRSADAGHLASADISSVAQAASLRFRLVGGNAISLLVAAHGLSGVVPERETNDADLGVPSLAAGSADLVTALQSAGYEQIEGNRFRREVEDDLGALELFIDVLVPSYTGRLQTNQPFGDLYVDAIPGLAIAIGRPPTVVEVISRLTSGVTVKYTVPLPDPLAALCMKAYAYRWRLADRDALDVWRLAEVAHALGLGVVDWPPGASGREAAAILHTHFVALGARGPSVATPDRGLQTRIRALLRSLVPAPPV